MPSLLIVDDDREIRTLLAEHLETHGFRVRTASNGKTMQAALDQQAVDLIVLDLNLPGEDGLILCRQLRAKSNVPVVMLTARADPVDRIIGLEMGADDYLPKPFEPRELVARIKSVLRRAGAAPSAQPFGRRATFAGWMLDRDTRALTSAQGRVIMLSTAEFDLLDALVRSTGKPVSRVRLKAQTELENADDRAIDLRISRLRVKLSDPVTAPELIRTVRNIGYMLAASVTWDD